MRLFDWLGMSVMAACLVLCAACSNGNASGGDGGGSNADSAAAADLAVAQRPPDLGRAPDLAAVVDLAAPPDLTREPDMAGVNNNCAMHKLPGTCDLLAGWSDQWIKCNLGCSTDKDCVTISAHINAFCRNACPVIANNKADGAYLQSLTNAYGQMMCGNAGCNCLRIGAPVCKNGMCTGG